MRHAAWVNLDSLSTTWVTVCPSPDCRLANAELVEVAAQYYGLPSPACRPLPGLPIAGTRCRMDAYGNSLVCVVPRCQVTGGGSSTTPSNGALLMTYVRWECGRAL
eukprot:1100761-Karenia_brevis.AAC.1